MSDVLYGGVPAYYAYRGRDPYLSFDGVDDCVTIPQENGNYTQLVSSGLRLFNLWGAGETKWQFNRIRRTAVVPITGIVTLYFPTFYMKNVGGVLREVPFPTSFRLQLGIEKSYEASYDNLTPSNRVASNVVTIPANDTVGFVTVDIDLGSYTIPIGQEYGIWTVIESSLDSGFMFPSSEMGTNSTKTQVYESYNTNAYAGDIIGSNYIANTTWVIGLDVGGGPYSSSPVAMTIKSKTRLVGNWCTIGSSIPFGTYDLYGGGANADQRGVNGHSGWADRFLCERHKRPNCNLSVPSESIKHCLIDGYTRRLNIIGAIQPTDLMFAHGSNDMTFDNTFNSFKADVVSLIRKVRSVSNPRITMSTIIPRATSSDGFATVVNQTPWANTGGASSLRGQWNSYIKGLPTGDVVNEIGANYIADVTSCVEHDPANYSGKWGVGPSSEPPSKYTNDGVHPKWDGSDRIATNLAGMVYTPLERFSASINSTAPNLSKAILGGNDIVLWNNSGVLRLDVSLPNGSNVSHDIGSLANGDNSISVNWSGEQYVVYLNGVKSVFALGYKRPMITNVFSNKFGGAIFAGKIFGLVLNSYFYIQQGDQSPSTVLPSHPSGADGTLVGGTGWKYVGIDGHFSTNALLLNYINSTTLTAPLNIIILEPMDLTGIPASKDGFAINIIYNYNTQKSFSFGVGFNF